MVTDYSEKYLPQNSHDATQQIHPFKKIPSKDLPSLLSRLEEEVQCMNTAVFETHAMMEHLRDTAGSNLFASMRRSLTKLSKYSRKCVKTTNTLKEQYEGLIRCNSTHDVPKSGAAAKKSKRKAVNKGKHGIIPVHEADCCFRDRHFKEKEKEERQGHHFCSC